MTFNPQEDIDYMRHALNLARRGLGRVAPNPSVGCILVKDGRVLAAARTGDGGRPHAEALALEKAGREAKGATAYVTLEPCSHHGKTPPCAGALVKAGVARAVIACFDPNPVVNGKGMDFLRENGVAVATGVMEKEAQALNKGFFLRVTEGRPFITLKIASGADGKVAGAGGKRLKITGDMAHRHAHLERAMHDAILVGSGTVTNDNPKLMTRLEGVEHKSIRIALDSHLKIPLESELVRSAMYSPLWIFHSGGAVDKVAALEMAGVRVFKEAAGHIGVHAVARTLAGEGVTRVLVEGGPKIWASFIEAGLYDRILWYRAPGDIPGGVDAFPGRQVAGVIAGLGLDKTDSRILGQDMLEIYENTA